MQLNDFHDPQPPPSQREGAPSMHDVAIALHRLRRHHGLAKYGSLLQAANGRSADIDRVQESLDGLVYELQRAVEAQAQAEALAEFRRRLHAHVVAGDSASSVDDAFEELMNPAALAVRADRIAHGLIADAGDFRAAAASSVALARERGEVGDASPRSTVDIVAEPPPR